MERIEPLKVTDENGRVWKFCGLEYCTRKNYALGYCNNHYNQYRNRGFVAPLINVQALETPPCSFDGCKNLSVTKRGVQLCSGHRNHITPTHEAHTDGKPRPLKYYMNEGFTENGRVCKVCKVEQPLSEYYDRNGHKGPGKACKAAKCKECYKKDIAYYSGKRDTMADGSDPLGYKVNPGEKERRLEAHQAKQRANWQKKQKLKNAG